ncbi:MAG: hypothetical protein HYV26_17410, partial [Candidatus Hydrogenedentes bacterium]|nr:hypothetical protein [Candidatus Hydrogenedentota bacterium]
ELPTLYHSAEFGAASPLQIARMLQWGDAHLRHETTLGGGRLVWSSNWYPNRGRSYTHSTYEMAYGEELNYALTNYLAGRAEEGHALLRATLCGIYNGPTPGGLACHSNTDGTQRANDEFADAISMWGRAVMEGLFGIQPHRPDGEVVLCPQPPKDWAKVSVAGPHLSYSLERQAQTTAIHWTSPVETRVRLLLPIPGSAVRRAQVDGVDAAAAIEPGHFGMNWAVLESRAAKEGAFLIEYGDQPPPVLPALDTTKQRAERLWRSPVQARDPSLWTLVDLSPVFNAAVTGALQQVTEKAVAPDAAMSQVGFGYWKDHLLQYHGSRNEAISDAAWRGKIEGDGIGWTTEHIPFKSPKEGPNIAVVTRAGGFPAAVEVPVRAKGRKLLLMLSGITFPAQSHVVNLRVTLHYADGVQTYRDLVNPIDIGDCWSTWCGRFHDTAANGFENIGGRSGPAGSAEVQDLTQPVAVDTEAHLVSMDLRGDAELESFSLEAVANDVIFGLMGASVLK